MGNVDTGALTISSGAFEQEWTLDQLGNWASFKQNDDGTGSSGYELEQTRTANDANEIGSFGATTGSDWFSPTYAAAGNTATGPAPLFPEDPAGYENGYTYDAWNRLVKIQYRDYGSPGEWFSVATYAYDGLSRRIQKTVGSDTFDDYHNESWQVVEVRKNQASDADPIEQFVYDTNYIDALVMRWYDANQDNAADEQFYLYDASFSVAALLDASGTAIERYRYSPYGQRIVLDADFTADADNATDYANHRGFQGLLHDTESGLIENRARMLDPLTGRFLQRDPMGYPDGMNAYAGYHVMYGSVDPWGLSCEDPCDEAWDEAHEHWMANRDGPAERTAKRRDALAKVYASQRKTSLTRSKGLDQAKTTALGVRMGQFGTDLQSESNAHIQNLKNIKNATWAAYLGTWGVSAADQRWGKNPGKPPGGALPASQIVIASAGWAAIIHENSRHKQAMSSLHSTYNGDMASIRAQYDAQLNAERQVRRQLGQDYSNASSKIREEEYAGLINEVTDILVKGGCTEKRIQDFLKGHH